jgi:hypothetical protein
MPIEFKGNDTQTAQEFEGRVPSKNKVDPKLLSGDRPPMFIYKWHPFRWSLIDGEWLPQLGKLKISVGLNAIDPSEGTAYARHEAMKKGWHFIEPEQLDDHYVREYDHVAGTAHYEKWHKPRMNANRRVDVYDHEGYVDFLRGLVASGVVGKPDPSFIQMKIEEQQQIVDMTLGSADSMHGKERYAKAVKKLEQMKAAADKLFNEPEKAKKK